jgi:hypothetical protein
MPNSRVDVSRALGTLTAYEQSTLCEDVASLRDAPFLRRSRSQHHQQNRLLASDRLHRCLQQGERLRPAELTGAPVAPSSSPAAARVLVDHHAMTRESNDPSAS